MDRVEQHSPLTMGWCLTCHREHANIATNTFQRASLSLSQKQKPVAGLDCASCHY
jgi:predicted CXXCH cytochrome family protein